MNRWVVNDALVIGAACAFWLLFNALGAWGWGFFLVTIVCSVLVPAVATTLVDGPFLWRPFAGALPNVLAAALATHALAGPDSWLSLVLSAMGAGTLVVFLIAMLAAISRRRMELGRQ